MIPMYGIVAVPMLPVQATPVCKLHLAIEKRDTAAARAVLEDTFWNNTNTKPDALHLLHAMKNADRDTARLLLGWGAAFTEAETLAACRLLGAEHWQVAATLLRGNGQKVDITGEPDPSVIIRLASGLMERFDQYGIGDRSLLASQVSETTALSFLDAMKRDDFLTARQIAEASGVQEKIDIDHIFSIALRRDVDEAYNLVLNIGMTGLVHKPLVIAPNDVVLAVPLLPILSAKHVLAHDQGAARAAFLAHWMVEGMWQEKFGEERDIVLSRAVPALFNTEFPATATEAKLYRDSHDTYCRDDKRWSRVEKALVACGYFDGTSFTAEQLRNMATTDELRASAVRRRFAEIPIDDFAAREKAPDLVEAFNCKALPLDADNIKKIVQMLYTQGKGSWLSRNEDFSAAQDVLRAMRDVGGDFSKVDPMDYMGKRDPGMAKMMLDMGITQTCHYDLSRVLKKTGGKVVIGAREGDKEYAYTQFICQLLLESSHPHLVMDMRGNKNADYQKVFVKCYLQNGGARVNFDYSPKKGMKP